MRWIFFAIVTYVLLALQTGLSSLLVVGDRVSPDLLFILGIFISVYAPTTTTVWAMLILGLLTDMIFPIQGSGPVLDFVLLGPHAIGFALAGWTALQLRGIFRRSLPGIVATVFVACFFAQLFVVATMTVRGMPWPTAQPILGWSASDELLRRLGCLIYTTILSIPLIYILGGMIKLFHFNQHRSAQSGYVMR